MYTLNASRSTCEYSKYFVCTLQVLLMRLMTKKGFDGLLRQSVEAACAWGKLNGIHRLLVMSKAAQFQQ